MRERNAKAERIVGGDEGKSETPRPMDEARWKSSGADDQT